MRNLTKVLALVLALALALSMTAGAFAGITYATDVDELTTPAAKAAYEYVTALGIVNGYEDGTFQGAKTIERDEFLKMLYVASTGKTNVEDFSGTDVTKIFADVTSTWAVPYLNWAYDQGIVAGYAKADGSFWFYPDQAVTATEAAKMLLVALGYDAKAEGYVNNTAWDSNVNGDAAANGFFANLTGKASDALTRENAAVLFYNALHAQTVEYILGAAVKGELNLAEKSFDLIEGEALYVANNKTFLREYYDVAANANWWTNTLQIVDYKTVPAGYAAFVVYDDTAINTVGDYYVDYILVKVADANFADLGEKFFIMTNGLTSGTYYKTAYAIFDTTSPLYSCVHTTNDNVSIKANKFANTVYAPTVAIDNTVFLNGAPATVATVTGLMGNNTTAPVKYVDKDLDTIIDSYFGTAYTYAKVYGVDATNVYLSVYDAEDDFFSADAGYSSIKLADIVGAELKAGDFVLFYKNAAEGKYYFKTLEIVTGVVTKYVKGSELYINGEKYEYSYFANVAEIDAAIGAGIHALNGTTFTFYVDKDATDKFVVSTAINEQTAYGNYGVVYTVNNTHKTVELLTEANTYETFAVKYFNGKTAYYTALQDMIGLDVYDLVYYYAVDGGIALYTADYTGDVFGTANYTDADFAIEKGVLYPYDETTSPWTIDYTAAFKNDRGVIFVSNNYEDVRRTDGKIKFIAYKAGELTATLKADVTVGDYVDEVLYVYDTTSTWLGYETYNIKAAKVMFNKADVALDDGALERDGEWLIFSSFTNAVFADGKWTYTLKFIDQGGEYKTVTYTTEQGMAAFDNGVTYLVKYADAENNVAASIDLLSTVVFDFGQTPEEIINTLAIYADIQYKDGKLVAHSIDDAGKLVVKSYDLAKTFLLEVNTTTGDVATMGVYPFTVKYDLAYTLTIGDYTVVIGFAI